MEWGRLNREMWHETKDVEAIVSEYFKTRVNSDIGVCMGDKLVLSRKAYH